MVFLTELESALLRYTTDCVTMILDSSGNTIAMNKLGLMLSDKLRLELIRAATTSKRVSDELELSDGQTWCITAEAVEARTVIRAQADWMTAGAMPIQRNVSPFECEDRSYERMLLSLSAALFDATVYLNSDFHLKSVSPQFASLFSIPSSQVLVGCPFKDLIVTDMDRERFEMYVESILCGRDDSVMSTVSSTVSTAASTPPVALMLEVVVGCGDKPVNVRLYLTSTSGDTTRVAPEYFMGIQATGESVLPLRGTRRPAQIKPTIPTLETEPYTANIGVDENTASVVETYRAATEVGDDEGSTLFEHPLSVMSNKPMAPPHISVVSMFYRILNRDLVCLGSTAEVEPGIQGAGWICPLFKISDYDAIREDVVKLLPNAKQEEFVKAEIACDLFECGRILEHSTVGNLNVMNWAKSKIRESSAHFLCSYTRFVLSKLSEMRDDELIPFFTKWMEGYESLNTFCSSMRATIALSVISCAIKRPHLFSGQAEISMLRTMFSNLISTTDSFGVTDQVRLPAVYLACILWARLQLDRGREQETVQILEGAVRDMELYSVRHPGSQIIRTLRAIGSYNLASLAIAKSDRVTAMHWMNEINDVLRTCNRVVMSDTYSKIRRWLDMLEEAIGPISMVYTPKAPTVISSILSSRS